MHWASIRYVIRIESNIAIVPAVRDYVSSSTLVQDFAVGNNRRDVLHYSYMALTNGIRVVLY